jgi:hypothetical protein
MLSTDFLSISLSLQEDSLEMGKESKTCPSDSSNLSVHHDRQIRDVSPSEVFLSKPHSFSLKEKTSTRKGRRISETDQRQKDSKGSHFPSIL